MAYLIILAIIFVYTSIVWTAVLVVYNLLLEPFDFGALSEFAGNLAILVLIAS